MKKHSNPSLSKIVILSILTGIAFLAGTGLIVGVVDLILNSVVFANMVPSFALSLGATGLITTTGFYIGIYKTISHIKKMNRERKLSTTEQGLSSNDRNNTVSLGSVGIGNDKSNNFSYKATTEKSGKQKEVDLLNDLKSEFEQDNTEIKYR